MLLNFTSIGAYPVWSSVAIVCSMLVLWAVTVHWEETVILEIRVRGPVALEDADRLGLRAEAAPVATVLRGAVADRPALHGALERILEPTASS